MTAPVTLGYLYCGMATKGGGRLDAHPHDAYHHCKTYFYGS